jgi:hypothetical protein
VARSKSGLEQLQPSLHAVLQRRMHGRTCEAGRVNEEGEVVALADGADLGGGSVADGWARSGLIWLGKPYAEIGGLRATTPNHQSPA